MRDPYEVLKVGRGASAAEIKSAYRKLAKALHPDANPGDSKVEQQFKEVSQAYGILGDAEKRKRFDRGEIDANGQEQSFAHGFGQRGGGFRHAAGQGAGPGFRPEDIFSELFGNRGRPRTAAQKGADVNSSIKVSFLEAAEGIRKRVRLADGKALNLSIPAGTEDGRILRLKGQGKPGAMGGAPGDALVEVKVAPHKHFTRNGKNVYLELPVTLQEALLGAEMKVPTIHGPVAMKVPAGSNSGTTLRLKGKGLAAGKGGTPGDQYVKLKLVLPDKPDSELSDFIKNWSKHHHYDPRKKAGLDDG